MIFYFVNFILSTLLKFTKLSGNYIEIILKSQEILKTPSLLQFFFKGVLRSKWVVVISVMLVFFCVKTLLFYNAVLSLLVFVVSASISTFSADTFETVAALKEKWDKT